MNAHLLRASALIVMVTLVACAGRSGGVAYLSPAQPDQPRLIEVTGPMVVGFFPTGAGADEHLAYALQETAACLAPEPVPVKAVQADRLVFRDGDRELDLTGDPGESTGCLMIAPGREPMIMRAIMGASSLVAHCPSAASIYFDVPRCCPSDWYCCPDGTVAGGAEYCDR